ncbi:hypothetical protein [Nocardioides stalactiti]|uniref:hypothetical protein n=1 Tax=Nocardioides stalactiti TaxID=2755356 RepID=UPI00160115FD|nr:hypothetical protein [Nocardioides stalactiti]
MFGFGWQDGTATVVARRLVKEWRAQHTATSPGGKRRKFEYILDVRPPDGSQRFRATCTNSWKDAVQGDEVNVRFHPKRQKVKIVEGRSRSQAKKPQPVDDRWRDMLDDEPGTPPPAR